MNKLHYLTFILIFSVSTKVYSCSCTIPEPSRIDSYVSDVFIANVVSSQSYLSFSKNRVVFEVKSILKGNSKRKVVLWTQKDESACGRNFIKEIEYLIYLQPEASSVGLCSSLRMDSDYHKKYIENIIEYYNSTKPINYAPRTSKDDSASFLLLKKYLLTVKGFKAHNIMSRRYQS